MTYKIPDSDKELKLLLSKDTMEELAIIYNKLRRTINGKTISDIALVYEKIQTFETVERVDLIIPYTFGHKRREPKGHRIWYLSQADKTSKYYNGNFFDIEIALDTKRKMRKRCRLSNSAVKLFKGFPQIKDNEIIKCRIQYNA